MKTAQTRKLISDNCRKALLEKQEKKHYIGSFVPYGYKKNYKTHSLEIDDKVAFIVYLIFDLYDKGFGFATIADYLNKRGIVPPSVYLKTKEYIGYVQKGYNNIWQRSSIRKIIINKVYNGYYHYSDCKTHPEIIDDDMWQKAQNRLNNRNGKEFYDLNGNEFNNKVYCGICNHFFTIETGRCKDRTIKYLRCSCYDKRGSFKYDCSNKLAIKYDELKDIVSLFIEKEIFNKVDLQDIQKEYITTIKNKSIIIHRNYIKMEKRELNSLKEKYQELIANINYEDVRKKIEVKKYEEIIKCINNRINENEKLLKEIYSFARTTIISNKDIFLDKYIIDNFIEKISVGVLLNDERNIEIILK